MGWKFYRLPVWCGIIAGTVSITIKALTGQPFMTWWTWGSAFGPLFLFILLAAGGETNVYLKKRVWARVKAERERQQLRATGCEHGHRLGPANFDYAGFARMCGNCGGRFPQEFDLEAMDPLERDVFLGNLREMGEPGHLFSDTEPNPATEIMFPVEEIARAADRFMSGAGFRQNDTLLACTVRGSHRWQPILGDPAINRRRCEDCGARQWRRLGMEWQDGDPPAPCEHEYITRQRLMNGRIEEHELCRRCGRARDALRPPPPEPEPDYPAAPDIGRVQPGAPPTQRRRINVEDGG